MQFSITELKRPTNQLLKLKILTMLYPSLHRHQWGIKVTNIELKHIELPETMKRAMANQAEAERERRARVIAALGEKQAAQSFYEAAKIISKEPTALHIRLFQTLNDISNEKSSTIIIPIPMEMMSYFSRKKN